ncbi:MAG: hypothetical protein K9G29_04585 [Crocinitomicaceae bacterium]|nr:hypothetical protein [Crocinitomicaceae bacterium]
MTYFTSFISFRIDLVLVVFMLLNSNAYSQSKKEQILILSNRLDSLKTVQSIEKQNFETRKKEIESSIANSDRKTTELLKTHSTKKENLQNLIKENQKLDQEILSLEHDLISIEDSIQEIISNQPIKLLVNIDNEKNDEELIESFNMSLSDVQHGGCTTFEKFSILGKQDFISSIDTFRCIVLGAICQDKIHPTSGTNFIGLIKISNSLQIKLIDIIEAKGSFGFGSCANLEGIKIMGRKNLCVILNYGYYGSRQSIEDRTFYKVNRSKIDPIKFKENEEGLGKKHEYFGGVVNNNFEGFVEWNIKFIESQKDVYDIEVQEKENNKSKVKTTILKFNENAMKYE